MPRYFFNVHFGDVPDLAEAVNQARKARAEIMDEDELDRLWLEIADENGRVLARVGR